MLIPTLKRLGKYHFMLMNFQRDDAWRMLIEMKQITQNIKHVDILCSHMFWTVFSIAYSFLLYIFFFQTFWPWFKIPRDVILVYIIKLHYSSVTVCPFKYKLNTKLCKLPRIFVSRFPFEFSLFNRYFCSGSILDGSGSSLCAFWNRRGEKTPSKIAGERRRRWEWYN